MVPHVVPSSNIFPAQLASVSVVRYLDNAVKPVFLEVRHFFLHFVLGLGVFAITKCKS